MDIDEILKDVRWFSQWVNPAGQTRYCVRPVNGLSAHQYVGSTPSEALAKMHEAHVPFPNAELFE